MRLQESVKMIGSGALAAILAAFVGGAFAASGPASNSISGGDVYQVDKPDCKAKPDDPRCSDKKQ
jgi:hypothetical protein